MRQRAGRFLPIAILAVTLNGFAPLFAFFAFASAVADPIRFAELCSEMKREGNRSAPAQQSPLGGCCGICAPVFGGTPLADTSSAAHVAPIYPRLAAVSWSGHSPAGPVLRIDSNAKARAPPSAA